MAGLHTSQIIVLTNSTGRDALTGEGVDPCGSALLEELYGPWVRVDVVRYSKRGSRGEVLVLSRGDVAVHCSTAREPTGGGRGGKLDCGRGDASTDQRVEEEWVRSDDVGRGRARIGA